jgi:hypothetical protein
MKIHLFPLFLIALLPLLVACDDAGTIVNSPQITLDDSKLQFVNIENIGGSDEIVGRLEANITPPISTNREDRDRLFTHSAVISPDGERIIFQRDTNTRGMICVYQFSTNATTCTDIGERLNEFLGGFWSPDGRYLALNMDLVGLRFLRDIDILLYDTQENRLINRTNDGVDPRDDFFGEGSEETRAKIWMDVAPTWSPNGDLYFFRNSVNPENDEWVADLLKIPASDITGTGEPEVILRYPSDRAFPVYRSDSDKLDGAMSISPNGQYLAYSAMSNDNEDPNNGIWIIDLAQKSVKIHLSYARLPVVMAGAPLWWVQKASENGILGIGIPHSLEWSADSNRLVIFLSNQSQLVNIFLPPLKYDVSANTLESFYDYSNVVEDGAVLLSTLFDEISLSADSNLVFSIISPTHKTVFYIGRNILEDEWILSAMPVTESGFVTPRRMASLSDFVPRNNTFASIGYSESTIRILTANNLITLTEQ